MRGRKEVENNMGGSVECGKQGGYGLGLGSRFSLGDGAGYPRHRVGLRVGLVRVSFLF